jgi:hypothetical protein
MMPSQHVYGHHQYNAQVEPAWMHQQSTHQHRAQQAAAAAASAAQQQHYNHIAAAHNTVNALSVAHAQEEMAVSEDNRRTLSYVADLLNENTREAALLELSKKREQVPELALILWHSFGMMPTVIDLHHTMMLTPCPRCYDLAATGDHLCLQPAQPVAAHGRGLQPSLQRPRAAPVCSVAQ